MDANALDIAAIALTTGGHHPDADRPLTDAARAALRTFWATLPASVSAPLSAVVKSHVASTGGAWAPCRTALRVLWAAMDGNADLSARWAAFAAESHWARIA